jgi:hypothetical protein
LFVAEPDDRQHEYFRRAVGVSRLANESRRKADWQTPAARQYGLGARRALTFGAGDRFWKFLAGRPHSHDVPVLLNNLGSFRSGFFAGLDHSDASVASMLFLLRPLLNSLHFFFH